MEDWGQAPANASAIRGVKLEGKVERNRAGGTHLSFSFFTRMSIPHSLSVALLHLFGGVFHCVLP